MARKGIDQQGKSIEGNRTEKLRIGTDMYEMQGNCMVKKREG